MVGVGVMVGVAVSVTTRVLVAVGERGMSGVGVEVLG